MALKPKQKLALLAEVNEFYQHYQGAAGTDWASGSSRENAERCRVVLNAHTEHYAEGWYINAAAMLTELGA